jgi:sugar/nucleoside kinase (ribokinase family)
VDLPCFPTPDGKFAVREIAEDLGGSATNACCGFVACGAAARLHSLIGDDEVADRLLARLSDKGIDFSLCEQIAGNCTLLSFFFKS